MRIKIQPWFLLSQINPAGLPTVDAEGYADLTSEQIVDLHRDFDVMLVSRGGEFKYDGYGGRKKVKKPEPKESCMYLDLKGGGFRQR